MNISDKLKTLRKEKGLTQKKLAELSGVSENAIKQYEGNKRTPRIEQLKLLADALNIKFGDLMEDDEDSEPTRDWNTAIGQRLKNLRQEKGLSRVEMANLSNIEDSYLESLEDGNCSSIPVSILRRLASTLNMDSYFILHTEEEHNNEIEAIKNTGIVRDGIAVTIGNFNNMLKLMDNDREKVQYLLADEILKYLCQNNNMKDIIDLHFKTSNIGDVKDLVDYIAIEYGKRLVREEDSDK